MRQGRQIDLDGCRWMDGRIGFVIHVHRLHIQATVLEQRGRTHQPITTLKDQDGWMGRCSNQQNATTELSTKTLKE